MKNLNGILSASKARISTVFGVAMATTVLFLSAAAMADEGVEAAGKNRYTDYCGVCHGLDAKGGWAIFKDADQASLPI